MGKVKLVIFLVATIVILGLGYKLRLRNYDLVPFPGESTDEYSNTWVGLSLLKLGVPVGISDIRGYDKTQLRYINVDRIYQKTVNFGPLQINRPWFDHPPAMGLLIGTYARAKNVGVFEDAILVIGRKPMVFLGTFTILCVMIFALVNFGLIVSLLSGIIYATSALIVVDSRMIQAENGYVSLFLITLTLIKKYEHGDKEVYLWMAGLMAALAVLFKIPALVVVVTGVCLLLTQTSKGFDQKIKEAIAFGSIAITGLFTFFIYGSVYDGNLFRKILLSNGTRYYGIGFNSFFDLLVTTKITISKYITDGWPLLGWLSVWGLCSKGIFKKTRYVVIPIVIYLALYCLLGSLSYGWYRIPFMPFLFVACAYFLNSGRKVIEKGILSISGMFIPIGVNLQKIYEGVTNAPTYAWRFFIPMTIFFLVGLVIFKDNKRINVRAIMTVILVGYLFFALYTNLLYNNMITAEYWYKSN